VKALASLVTTVVFFLGWLSAPRAVLTEPLLALPPCAHKVRLLRCAIPADSRKGFLVGNVTSALPREVSENWCVRALSLLQPSSHPILSRLTSFILPWFSSWIGFPLRHGHGKSTCFIFKKSVFLAWSLDYQKSHSAASRAGRAE